MKHYERVCAKIDLDALEGNIEAMKSNLLPETKIMAVIKTDGYGHGAIPIAWELEKLEYIYGYGVATAEEAMQLKEAGIRKPILVLGYTFPYSYEELIQNEIRPTVFREDMLTELSKEAVRQQKECLIHIGVDTGMSRIGIRPDEQGLLFVKKAIQTKGIRVEGIFTHFSRADESDKSITQQQLEIFKCFIEKCEEETHYHFPITHCSNSAGIVEMKGANMDMVRAGITIYGLWPSDEVSRNIISLKPVMSLVSHISYIKEVETGTPVSYGGTFVTDRKTIIATIPVGYGDGYPRALSGKGYVLIHGQKAPILGRICMDQFMVDITDIPDVNMADTVTLIGQDGNCRITMEELGDLSGKFNYEFACDLGKRIPRMFYQDQKEVFAMDYFNRDTIQKLN